jgi:hypothetical protein
MRTWSRVGLREQECDYRLRMTAETYSTVGRSLALTLLNVWEKYRERWGADDYVLGTAIGRRLLFVRVILGRINCRPGT